jgi:hypothetical protein
MSKMKTALPWIAIGMSTAAGMGLAAYSAVCFTKAASHGIPISMQSSRRKQFAYLMKSDKKATIAALAALTIPAVTIAIVSKQLTASVAATTASAALATTGAQALREAVQTQAPDKADAIFSQADSKVQAYQQAVTGTMNRKAPVAIGEGPAILPEWTGLGNELMIFARSRRPFYCCAEAVEKAFAQASMKAMQDGGYCTYNDVYELLNLTPCEEGDDRKWDVCQQGEWIPTITPCMVDGSAILMVQCDSEIVY